MNAPGVPRVVRGIQRLRQLLTAWVEAFDEFRGEGVEYIDRGRHVVCVTDYDGKSRESLALRLKVANVFEFRDGKLVQATLGYETASRPSKPWGCRSKAACANVAAMALLSRAMRMTAITGRTDYINAWCSGRQVGRWAWQTSRAAPAPAQRIQPAVTTRPPLDPAETLRQLTELHGRGVVTDAEFETLRADLRA